MTQSPSELMTQPAVMQTARYRYGIDIVDGNDAWAVFCASADGDVSEISRLVEKDARLVDAQYWYQFPLHLAVWQNQVEAVRFLLDHGADIGHSHWWYRSWNRLLPFARSQGLDEIAEMLEATMRSRFNYHPEFEATCQAARSDNRNCIDEVLSKIPISPRRRTPKDRTSPTMLCCQSTGRWSIRPSTPERTSIIAARTG